MSEYKSTEEEIENLKESAEKAVDAIEDAVEDAVDAAEDAVEDAVDAVEEAVEKAKPPLMKLKDENPKVFFGGIAAIVIVVGIFLFSGGDSKKLQAPQIAHSVGQTYTLQAPNALPDSGITLKILKIPGQMAAFDSESEDVVCNAPTGTRATIQSFQEAFGKKNLFAQVEILEEVGDCRKGVKGWTLTSNLK